MAAFDLFGDDPASPPDARELHALDLPGADLRYAAQAWPRAEADALYLALLEEIAWAPHRLRLFGRELDAPRLSCWIGDADAVYAYSGARFAPQAWTPSVARVRDALQARLGLGFNSVLANLYRDGRDTVGWHSDDEPELGAEPVIASASFGAPRTFRLRSRQTREAALSIELAHGSLLVMAGATQRLYQHALPRRTRVAGPRINLTFRRIATRTA
ncbi:alpha-ketoglutarate-dependent dioxygenase AlkB family protein [Dokdonella sp.]|uniref:alpha-ketoglutarate-dependent dioxygenase AlkB family protein n=1 Tax=Dokdonella sp. TaxID=2291710 RepID=UPI002F417F42